MDLPEIFKGPMTPGKWKALGAFLQRGGITGGPGVRVRTVGSQTIISTRRGRSNGSGGTGPFDVTLNVGGTTEAPTYSVSVADGWVNQRMPGVGAIPEGETEPPTCTAMHKPHNILWGDDGAEQDPVKLATDRRSFPITVGQQVSVVVLVDAEGNINAPEPTPPAEAEPGPVKIAIEDRETSPEADKRSLHYVPPRPVDGDTGAAGEYHYKLAILRDVDATHTAPWLELFLAGSHLDHFAELPILDNSAALATNKGRPFWKYDPEKNTYLFRTIDCTAGQLKIVEAESGLGLRGNSFNDDIQITIDGGSPVTLAEVTDGLITAVTVADIDTGDAFPGGDNLNHEIYQLSYDNDGHIYGSATLVHVLYWRNGLFIGTTDPEDSETVTPIIAVSHKLVNMA